MSADSSTPICLYHKALLSVTRKISLKRHSCTRTFFTSLMSRTDPNNPYIFCDTLYIDLQADKGSLHTLSTVESWLNEGGNQLYGFTWWPLWCMHFPCISESVDRSLCSDSCLHRQIMWPNESWSGRENASIRPLPLSRFTLLSVVFVRHIRPLEWLASFSVDKILRPRFDVLSRDEDRMKWCRRAEN